MAQLGTRSDRRYLYPEPALLEVPSPYRTTNSDFSRLYRVADVCVVPSSEPIQGMIRTPPLLCVEVLSPEDRFSRVLERVQEYTRMGVPQVWIIDPISREIWTVQGQGGPGPLEGTELTLPNTPVRIPVAEIFAEIDEAPPATDN